MKVNRLMWALVLMGLGLVSASTGRGQNTNTTNSAKPLLTAEEASIRTSTNSALNELRKKAEGGDVDSQVMLGIDYLYGKDVPKDAVEAEKWFRKAAERGASFAQWNLGIMYLNGNGVNKDSAEAVKWLSKAAEQGDADAQNVLGWMYLNGYGVTKDQAEAIKWLTKSAANGNLQAAGRLACHYAFTDKNIEEALQWFRFAAERGNVTSQKTLASFYKWGGFLPFNPDVEKDLPEAAKWYLRAARQGDGDAQIRIGEIYCEGDGIGQDFIKAYKWFNIAAASQEKRDWSVYTPETKKVRQEIEQRTGAGETIAEQGKAARDKIALQMTPAQIAEAQRLSRQFKPRKESEERTSVTREDTVPAASGTGFFISEDGFLITNEHVVRDAAQIRLVTGAGLISARVVKVDAANDLALLKAEGRFAALPVAASRVVKLGGTVATVGFPNISLQGFAPKLAKGEIASLSGAGDDARYFQISVPVQPGNSGGALVDERGNVVGVVSAKLSARAALAASGALPENVNYAVKSSFLLSFLESVPAVSAKLKNPISAERKFDDVVNSAQQAAVLVLVY